MSRSMRVLLALGLLASLVAFTPAADAQTIMATIRGKVVDQQGAVLPGVTITARQLETNTTRTVVTTDHGQYFMPSLPAGKYEVTAALEGFAPAGRPVDLTVGAEFTVDFSLRVSAVAESVTVTGEAPLLETSKTSVGQTISKAQVDNLPTVNRDFLSLAQLAPGVSGGVGGNGRSIAPPGPPEWVPFVAVISIVVSAVLVWPLIRAAARRLEGKGADTAALRGEIDTAP